MNCNNTMPRAPQPLEEYLTTQEVKDYCKVSRQTIYRWRQSGKLKTYTFANSAIIRFKRSDVEAAWEKYDK